MRQLLPFIIAGLVLLSVFIFLPAIIQERDYRRWVKQMKNEGREL